MSLQFYYNYEIWFSLEPLSLLIRLHLNIAVCGNCVQLRSLIKHSSLISVPTADEMQTIQQGNWSVGHWDVWECPRRESTKYNIYVYCVMLTNKQTCFVSCEEPSGESKIWLQLSRERFRCKFNSNWIKVYRLLPLRRVKDKVIFVL